MPRILLSILIGVFSAVAWFIGGSFFEGHGGHPVRENVAGCVALILYVVLGQFLIPRDPTAPTAEDWRVRASMAAPLLLFVFLILTTEGGNQFFPLLLMLGAGCTGVLLGGILARSVARAAQPDMARAAARSKLVGNTCAALYAGVFVILFALVVPANVGNTNLPRSAGGGMMVVAVLHALFAAAVLWRTRQGKAPVGPALFGFLMTLFLVLLGAAFENGPAMRTASIALFLCAALDMVVCACCAGVAIQCQDVHPFPESHP